MNQDLLAPPKMTAKVFAVVALCLGAAMAGAGIVAAAVGAITVGQLLLRTVIVAGILGAAAWARGRLAGIAQRTRPERMPWVHACVFAVGFGAFMLALSVMLGGTMFGSAFASNWWQVPAMFGMTLAMGGWGRRVGKSMHCPACEYEFKFDHEDDAPIRCPECGTAWLGMLKKGRRVRSPRLIAGGLALVFTVIVLMQPIFYMGWLAPHLPTPLLFASLYASPKTWYSVWDELAARPLDPWSIRVMAERVLRYRRQDQYDSSPSKWFEAMGAAGKMPSELLERYYREGFEIGLEVPERVAAGQPFVANLRVKRVASGSSQNAAMFFGGYGLDGGPARTGRLDRTLWAHELRPGVFEGERRLQAQTLTADRPGEVRVQVEFWIVYQPSYREQLSWQADGTPARPVAAVWFERVELEKTVRVK